MKVIVDAFAKINLLLDIAGRLPNGYHSLHMIMQSVSLCDTVTVERGEGGIRCACPGVPTDESNIAWKAVTAFAKATGLDCADTCITIEKRIPCAAGLAGGSADGAAVLAALNILHGTALSAEALCRIGASFGASRPNDGMQLVNKKDHIFSGLYFIDCGFDAILKIAPVFGAGYHTG